MFTRIFAAFAAMLLSGVVIAGGLTPPSGPVAPTMKPLDAVEPRIAINQQNTPADADSVFVITQPGSYYLTGDVTFSPNPFATQTGIKIAASDVTIDMNGFAIVGTGNTFGELGIEAIGNQSRIMIKNGRLRRLGAGGIDFSDDTACRVEGVFAHLCEPFGFSLGRRSTIIDSEVRESFDSFGLSLAAITLGEESRARGTRVIDSTIRGFNLGEGCVMIDCHVERDALYGFLLADGCVVRESSAVEVQGIGFDAGHDAQFDACVSRDNGEGGFRAGRRAVFDGCVARNNAESGFSAGDHSVLTNCQSLSNTSGGFGGGQFLRLDGCVAAGNGSAGMSFNIGADIIRCTIRNNGFDADVPGIGILALSSVRDCMIVNNADGAIRVAGNATPGLGGVTIERNTIISNSDYAIDISANDCRVEDNTFGEHAIAAVRVMNGAVTGTIVVGNTISGSALAYTGPSNDRLLGEDVSSQFDLNNAENPFVNVRLP